VLNDHGVDVAASAGMAAQCGKCSQPRSRSKAVTTLELLRVSPRVRLAAAGLAGRRRFSVCLALVDDSALAVESVALSAGARYGGGALACSRQWTTHPPPVES
jgi:hypothetical protein